MLRGKAWFGVYSDSMKRAVPRIQFHLVPLIAATVLLQCTLFALPSDFDPTYVPSWVVPGASDSVPGWITGRGAGELEFRRAFFVQNPATWASLTLAAHDEFEILVNGKTVASGSSARGASEYDLGDKIIAGQNVLQIRVKTNRAWAALIACLQVAGRAPLVTGSSWQQRTASSPAAEWQPAVPAAGADQLPTAAQIPGWPAFPAGDPLQRSFLDLGGTSQQQSEGLFQAEF